MPGIRRVGSMVSVPTDDAPIHAAFPGTCAFHRAYARSTRGRSRGPTKDAPVASDPQGSGAIPDEGPYWSPRGRRRVVRGTLPSSGERWAVGVMWKRVEGRAA
jgi:hypothetical protein